MYSPLNTVEDEEQCLKTSKLDMNLMTQIRKNVKKQLFNLNNWHTEICRENCNEESQNQS